jgi:uncharacterized protein
MTKPKGWFRYHQVTTFFILTYIITWGIGVIAILYPEQFTRIVGELNYYNPVALFAIAAPTISATILAWVWEGKPGLKILYARLIQWRFGIQWYAFILIGIPLLGWLSTLVADATPVFVITTPALAVSIFLNLLYTGPLCEELGWRGYALPRLLKQFNPLAASLILGFFWGVWHLPSFYISSLVQSGLSLPMFLVFGLCTSVMMTWIFHHTGGSVLAAVLFHYTINISFSLIGAPLPVFGLEMLILAVLVVALDKKLGWFNKPFSRNHGVPEKNTLPVERPTG